MKRVPTVFSFVVGVVVFGTSPTLADEPARRGVPSDAPKLNFEPVYFQGQRVSIDGIFEDWHEPNAQTTEALTAGEHEYDWTGPADLSADVKVQYNDEKLYVAIFVRDNAFKAPDGKLGADTVDLWFDVGGLARSRGESLLGLRVDPSWILGDQALEVAWRAPKSRTRDEVSAIESAAAKREDGYAVEVAIPFSELASAPPTFDPMGFCVVVNDWDHDDEREEQASVSTCPLEFARRARRDAEDLGRIEFDGSEGIWRGVAREIPEAETERAFETRGDVGGDGRREVVAVAGGRLLVLGKGLGRGDWYAYNLGLGPPDSVLDVELHDVTPDDTEEVAVTIRRTYNVDGKVVWQDRVSIFEFEDDLGLSEPLASVEVRNESEDGAYIANELSFGRSAVTQRVGEHEGWERETYLDPDGGFHEGYEPLLVPWSKPKRRKVELTHERAD